MGKDVDRQMCDKVETLYKGQAFFHYPTTTPAFENSSYQQLFLQKLSKQVYEFFNIP